MLPRSAICCTIQPHTSNMGPYSHADLYSDGAAVQALLNLGQQRQLKVSDSTGCAFVQRKQQQRRRHHLHHVQQQAASGHAVIDAAETACDPEQYLLEILSDRGYLPPKQSSFAWQSPTASQVAHYDLALGQAVRNGAVEELLRMVVKEGRCLSACNKFGESISHLACRQGDPAVLRAVLRHGGSLTRCDDLGRVPAHDTCWASQPQWDIVRMHLDADAGLLLAPDNRGWTPLRYVKPSNWAAWRAFLDEVKDRYWPRRGAC